MCGNETVKPRLLRCVQEMLRRDPRLRFFLISLLGLWIVAGTRFVTERVIYRERNLKEAVAAVSPGNTTGTVSFAAKLKERFLTEADQKKLLRFAADEIGLTVTSDPEVFVENDRTGFVYRKKAKNADTCIKIIAVPEKEEKAAYYLIVTLHLFQDDGDGAMYYRSLIDGMARELGVSQEQVSVQICGRFPHGMTTDARNRLTDRVLDKLGCEIVCENRDESLYTVYGYTKGMKEYVCSGKDRINVQLAIYYDEVKDETVLCVASPVITGEPGGTR